jgi:hypothetical protein
MPHPDGWGSALSEEVLGGSGEEFRSVTRLAARYIDVTEVM